MRKEFLIKRLARLRKKVKNLTERGLASTDAAEVRAINEEVNELNDEIDEYQAELDDIEAEEERANDPGATVTSQTQIPANAQRVGDPNGGSLRGSFQAPEQRDNEPIHASIEYRRAFMAYVQRGTAIPSQYVTRDALGPEDTGDLGALIPITVMQEIINTVRKRYGNLYNKVRKTNIRGGVEYPVGALQATFKWITESTVSPRQKAGSLAKIQFSYHMAEIRISQTLLSQILTLDAFEAEVVRIIAIAYLEMMDQAIVNGSGEGQPLGILNDPRVTNVVTMTAAQMSDWTQWRKRFFAKLPLGYRDGEFIFPLSTVDSYLETMADNNNNPIFQQATGLQVNDGDAVNPNGTFFGRAISLVEPDIIADFDTASAGDVVGVFWQPDEYAVNENMSFMMRRYFDEETNEWVDKALCVVDGKVLNPTGFYLIKKA